MLELLCARSPFSKGLRFERRFRGQCMDQCYTDVRPTTPGVMMALMLKGFRFRLAVRRARKELEQIARRYCTTAKVGCFSGATARLFSFRIAVPTDRNRDQMRKEPQLYQEMCGALLRALYSEEAVPVRAFSYRIPRDC